MTTKIIATASKADVDLINAIAPPTKGVNVGDGIHVEIPEDWADRIANGEDVPGCTYAKLQDDGSLVVDDLVQVELTKPGKDTLGIAARLTVAVAKADPISIDVGQAVEAKL